MVKSSIEEHHCDLSDQIYFTCNYAITTNFDLSAEQWKNVVDFRHKWKKNECCKKSKNIFIEELLKDFNAVKNTKSSLFTHILYDYKYEYTYIYR